MAIIIVRTHIHLCLEIHKNTGVLKQVFITVEKQHPFPLVPKIHLLIFWNLIALKLKDVSYPRKDSVGWGKGGRNVNYNHIWSSRFYTFSLNTSMSLIHWSCPHIINRLSVDKSDIKTYKYEIQPYYKLYLHPFQHLIP